MINSTMPICIRSEYMIAYICILKNKKQKKEKKANKQKKKTSLKTEGVPVT